MKYLEKTFSVAVGGKKYADGWEQVFSKPDQARIYPCDKCGLMRSKDEGGTIFTVCDNCWDPNHTDK